MKVKVAYEHGYRFGDYDKKDYRKIMTRNGKEYILITSVHDDNGALAVDPRDFVTKDKGDRYCKVYDVVVDKDTVIWAAPNLVLTDIPLIKK